MRSSLPSTDGVSARWSGHRASASNDRRREEGGIVCEWRAYHDVLAVKDERGRGYVPGTLRGLNETKSIGRVVLDASFAPGCLPCSRQRRTRA